LWFGVHPTHVESVAWVAERKDVLSALFFLLTLWAYARYAEESKVHSLKSKVSENAARAEHAQPTTDHLSRITHHRSRYYTLALLFYVLGLMSKPMLVTLPFVLLLLDYWPLRRIAFPAVQDSGTAALNTAHHTTAPILLVIPQKLQSLLF